MFDRLMFKELLYFMMKSLNEKLIIKQDDDNKYVITDTGINTDEENFTQINFRFENNTMIIPWFYLSKPNKGIGSNIMKWYIEFCMENGINAIEVRSVRQDKQGMKKLLKKFGFKMIQSDDEYMNFKKIL